jgi:cytochrome c-type biogenesis protein CcmF
MASPRLILAKAAPYASAASIALWLFYLSRFILLDTSFLDVYANTSWGMPMYYRAAASLVNIGGIMLYISAVLGAAALALRSWRLSAASAAFLASAAYWGAFSRWAAGGPGIGLNPLLRNPWALPHPLLVITSYALVVAAFLEPRARGRLGVLAWVFSTAGLAAGAYWSYTTFGWGGYWAWDPVETSVFVIWLFLTAWVHGGGPGALAMSLSGVFLTMAVTYSGVSPLHSFAGAESAGRWLMAPSIAAFLYGLYKLRLERGGLYSYVPPLAVGVYIYWLLAAPTLAQSLGLSVAIPSGDSAVALIHPVLVPAVFAAFYAIARRRFSARLSAAYVAASLAAGAAAVAAGIRWSPLSSPLTNAAVLALAFSSPLPLASAALVFRKDAARSVAHVGFVVLAVGAALSGPYAYHTQYGVVVPLDVEKTTLVPLQTPYGAEALSVEVRGWRLEGPKELVSIPPYLSRFVSGDLAAYMGVWRLPLRFAEVQLNGTRYVVAFGNFTPGLHTIGGYWLYVNSTALTPAGRLLVAALGLGERPLLFSPQRLDALSAFAVCGPNATSLNLLEERVRLSVGGVAVDVVARYEASGEFKLVRGLIHGVAAIPRGLDDIYIAVTPEVAVVGNVSYTRLALELARRNVEACLPMGAWMLLSTYSGRPLGAGEVEELLKRNPQGYVAMIKVIPMVQLVWAGAALLVAGGILYLRKGRVA